MIATIYTCGYTSTKPGQWQSAAQKLDLTVIDTRITGCKIVNWTANDLRAAAESPSAEAAANMPLQMSMFGEMG